MTVFQDKTVAEYLMTEDKELIDVVLQNVKPKRIITSNYRGKFYQWKPRINDLFEIEYKWVIKIKQGINNANLNSVKEILSGLYAIKTDEQFYSCSVFDVFAAYAWIVEEIENVYEVEKMKLHKKPTNKQIAAGIEEFDQLDDVPAIDALAGGDITKWDEVLELPYGKVLRKMLLGKIQRDYDERYSKMR